MFLISKCGLRDMNPELLAPEARIISLDQRVWLWNMILFGENLQTVDCMKYWQEVKWIDVYYKYFYYVVMYFL